MTWLDERIFGFRAAATAPNSDEEDAGDYDNVIGFIPGLSAMLHPATAAAGPSRSRNSSYADLTRLRMSAQAEDGAREKH
jgi:glycerol-3-phosphate O-acyltransferase/dihydroxyacetone phosphate acyltransferase